MNSVEEREAFGFVTTSNSSLSSSATEDDLIVAQVLLELEKIVKFPVFIWGCRKRRSCFNSVSCAPPSVQGAEEEEIEVKSPRFKAEEESAAALGGTSSPATPLSFSPSESDGKSKRTNKNSKKRSRAECIHMIEELTQQGNLLRSQVEDRRKQNNALMAQNSDLKSMRQEVLKTRHRKEEPRMEMGRFLNLGMGFTEHNETGILPHQQPFVADQTAHNLHKSFRPLGNQVYPPNNGLEQVNRVGPVGIPDLNLAAEEAFGVDFSQTLDLSGDIADKRASFAEARRRRKGIIKIRSMRSACGIKFT